MKQNQSNLALSQKVLLLILRCPGQRRVRGLPCYFKSIQDIVQLIGERIFHNQKNLPMYGQNFYLKRQNTKKQVKTKLCDTVQSRTTLSYTANKLKNSHIYNFFKRIYQIKCQKNVLKSTFWSDKGQYFCISHRYRYIYRQR